MGGERARSTATGEVNTDDDTDGNDVCINDNEDDTDDIHNDHDGDDDTADNEDDDWGEANGEEAYGEDDDSNKDTGEPRRPDLTTYTGATCRCQAGDSHGCPESRRRRAGDLVRRPDKASGEGD